MKMKKNPWLSFILAAVLLAAASVPPLAADNSDSGGETAYQQALQLRSQGRWLEAEKAFQQAIQAEPNNPDYHFELSNLYATLYDNRQGAATSQRALTLLSFSQRELEQVVAFRPDHLPARFNLGVVYKREGKYEKAREEFRRVLALSPKLASAWYQIGATYKAQGFWDEAEDAFRKAKELNYDTSEVDTALQDVQIARTAPSSSRSGLGDLFGGQNAMASNQAGDLMGRQNPYDNLDSNSQSSNPNGSSMGAALPSMAGMMIQQFLSRRSQSSSQQ